MPTFKDPYAEEEELKDDQLHRLEVIDKLESPEDIKAASELFDPPKEDDNKSSDDDPDKTPKGDETEGADKSNQTSKPTTENKPEDNSAQSNESKAPIQSPQKEDKAKTDKAQDLIEITDEYIAQADERDRKILEKLKGEKFTPKALSITINAQRLVGKRSEQLFNKQDIKQPEQYQQRTEPTAPQNKLIPDVEKAKDQMIYQRLVQEFPELPEDPQERKSWLNNLNYEDREEADRFLELKRQVVQDIERDYHQIITIRENYDQINKNNVEEAVKTIQDFAANFNADLKALGYDFTIDKDGNNTLLDSIIFNENGEPKSKIVQIGKKGTLLEGIPIIDSEALVTEFYRLEMPKIMAKIKANAHLEGYKAKDADKDGTPKTLADATTKGQKREIISRITAEDIDKIDDPDKIREILENAVIK